MKERKGGWREEGCKKGGRGREERGGMEDGGGM